MFHGEVSDGVPTHASAYDYKGVDIEEKNRLNKMGEEYFSDIKARHEPYFEIIAQFLKSNANNEVRELYFSLVDQLRSIIAADRQKFGGFEFILLNIAHWAVKEQPELKKKRPVLNILLSFMYLNCDLGKKQ